MTMLPTDRVVMVDLSRPAATQDPSKVVPRLETNSCFARPWRVVTRNGGYDKSMKYRKFRTEEQARAYLDKARRKAVRKAARENWKVIWP